jgi:hypothetical protein
MVLLQVKGRKAYVFMAEPEDTGNDSHELQLLKARTARGVSQVDQSSGFTVIHMQAHGRGPLQCEQQLKDAMS